MIFIWIVGYLDVPGVMFVASVGCLDVPGVMFVASVGCLDVPGVIFCGSVIFFLDRLTIYLNIYVPGKKVSWQAGSGKEKAYFLA